MPALKRSSVYLAVWLLFAAGPVSAVPVEDLYVAEVLVSEESSNQLAVGARKGLMQVLIRVSGTAAVKESPAVREAMSAIANYYYQYSFHSTDRTIERNGEEQPARLLRIRFEPSAVAKLLRRGGFPVWGSNRPSILVWIAVRDDEGRRLVSEAEDSELIRSLERQAKRRGLPLLYPLLDLEDEANLSPAAVWGFFLGRVAEASRRYNPDSILTGRVLQRSDGRWSAHWSYLTDERWVSVDNVADDLDAVVAGVIDRVADDLVARYALDSSRGFVWIRVEAVKGLEDYASVSRYLENLLPVLDSQLVEVTDDQVLYRLNTEGQSRQLVELIELDKKMALQNPEAVGQNKPLRYRWLD